ncbi:MAG: family transporter protein [Phycisphaerales bacterium]|nr:family transporter protein [Phycisphaerales bacterium]
MTSVQTLEPLKMDYAPAGHRAPAGSRLRALWALYVLTVRQHLHGKRWMVMAVLFLLPAGLVVLIRSLSSHVPSAAMEFIFAFMFIPQALLPLVALIYGSGIIQDEQEEQTLTYLLIRPISKWGLYTVKLLATLTTTVSLTALFTALTYAAVYYKAETVVKDVPQRCLEAMALHSLAVVAYCCLFGLMSLLTKRTLIVGIIYSAIFEGLLANLPLGIRLVTVIYYTRVIAYRTMPFVEHAPHGTFDLASPVWQMDIQHDPQLLEHPQVGTCVLGLLGASFACAVLAAFMCARREFHVKTPEKN